MKTDLAASLAAFLLLAALGAIGPWLDQHQAPAVQIPVYARPQHNLPPATDRLAEAQAAAEADAIYANMSDAERMAGVVLEPVEGE